MRRQNQKNEMGTLSENTSNKEVNFAVSYIKILMYFIQSKHSNCATVQQSGSNLNNG